MCNNLKNGNRVYKIPEWGFGYKVFRRGRKEAKCLSTFYRWARIYRNKWVKWNTKSTMNRWGDDGFCFLLTAKDVKDFMGGYTSSHRAIYRIRYRQGMGRRKEFGDYMSSLCKEFKILKEVDIKELR